MSFLQHRGHDDRPWGYFDRFTKNEPSTVKLITILAGKRFSLQKHAHRSEFWYIISGSGTAIIGDNEHQARPGDEFEIPTETIHRLTAEQGNMVILEITHGTFDENDIVRMEDDFGRNSEV